jgi:hypothetical protein
VSVLRRASEDALTLLRVKFTATTLRTTGSIDSLDCGRLHIQRTWPGRQRPTADAALP